jgi:hypothetical protein
MGSQSFGDSGIGLLFKELLAVLNQPRSELRGGAPAIL